MPIINELLNSKIPIGYQRRDDDELNKSRINTDNNTLTRDQQLEKVLLGLKARSAVLACISFNLYVS